MEALHGREISLDEVRDEDEHYAADQGGEEDRPRNGLARIASFLRQAGHRIETQE
ncbi:hypothetical protein D3C84_1301500 [compost metagenome]